MTDADQFGIHDEAHMINFFSLLILDLLSTMRSKALMLGILVYPGILYLALQLSGVKTKNEAYLVSALSGLALVSGCFTSPFGGQKNIAWDKCLHSLPCGPVVRAFAERWAQFFFAELSVIALFVISTVAFAVPLSPAKMLILNVILLIATVPFFLLSILLRVRFSLEIFTIMGRIVPILLLTNLVLMVPDKDGISSLSTAISWSPFSSLLQLGWGVIGGYLPMPSTVFSWLGLWVVIIVFVAEGLVGRKLI